MYYQKPDHWPDQDTHIAVNKEKKKIERTWWITLKKLIEANKKSFKKKKKIRASKISKY